MAPDLPRLSTVPSIYEHIRHHLDPAGRLEESGLTLPDEARVTSGASRWVAGGLDGAFAHHGGGSGDVDRAEAVAGLFATACKRPSKRNLRRLYAAVAAGSVLDLVDPMVKKLVDMQPNRDALHGLGRWLAATGTDRGAVKLGIAVLGATGLGNDVGVVRALGAHEEFTLYAAVAVTNGLAEPESELWALARAVDGWGRIHCVERLRDTADPQIRGWILREGFRNSIMYEYLAYLAATSGGLLDALRGPDADRELLTASGEIFEALVMGGPAEDLDDYEAGADAVEAYLRIMDTRAESIGDYHAVAAIRGYLAAETGWEGRSQHGWSATRREAFEARCNEILQRDEWTDRIAVGLLSDDTTEFRRAEQAARARGIDTFDIQVEKIKADPLGGAWFHAWQQADDVRARLLAALARELLPLKEVASGPTGEIGLGPRWRSHSALDWTLQALSAHTGVGADIVLTGLQSPTIRNRNMALRVLKIWPRSAWPEGAGALAQGLAERDPNESTREFAGEIVRAESP